MNRDLYKEYREGLLSWDAAFFIANNLAATACTEPNSEAVDVDWYAGQMESLAVDLACGLMTTLGYTQDNSGIYFKPGEGKTI